MKPNTRRDFLKLATFGAAALVGRNLAPAAPAAKPLNVLLLVSDDCRAVQGCYGEPTLTPRIDQLARRGLRFDRAYCQYPLCNPSRSSFLTGLRPDTSGVSNNQTRFRDVRPQTVSLPELFKKNGYFVARVGKLYHYGVPNQIGTDGLDDPVSWEQVVNPRGRDCDDEDKIFSIITGQQATVAVGARKYGGTLSWLAADGADTEQTDGKIAQEACKLLREHKEKPFFLAVGFFRPHTPYVSPKKYFNLYPPEKLALAQNPAGDREGKPPAALTVTPPHYGMDEAQQRTVMQAYYASVSFMDTQFGLVLDELERQGLAQNTVVVFLSDHGYHLGEHGQWQKLTVFEEAARVPLIIAAPGMKTAGKATSRLAELVDVYPTLADLCGLTPPPDLEGASLRPLLDDPERAWKKGAFTQVVHGRKGGHADGQKGRATTLGRSVRTERYRYTEWSEGRDGVELYDHTSDPHEWHNLADDPKSAAAVQDLKTLLHGGWRAAQP